MGAEIKNYLNPTLLAGPLLLANKPINMNNLLLLSLLLLTGTLTAQRLTLEVYSGIENGFDQRVKYTGANGTYFFNMYGNERETAGLRASYRIGESPWYLTAAYGEMTGTGLSHQIYGGLRGKSVNIPQSSLNALNRYDRGLTNQWALGINRSFTLLPKLRATAGLAFYRQGINTIVGPGYIFVCFNGTTMPDWPIFVPNMATEDPYTTSLNERHAYYGANVSVGLNYTLFNRLLLRAEGGYLRDFGSAMGYVESTDPALSAAVKNFNYQAVDVRFGVGWVILK